MSEDALRFASRLNGRLLDSAVRKRLRRAFTLIELMVSIALVVFLMAGINAVFTYTTKAVGTGQAFTTATRDSRAAQATFSQDFADFVANGSDSTSSACTIINCTAIPAFRNKQDELGWTPTVGGSVPHPLQDPIYPNQIISPATYNFRNHRTDTISFFARGLFPRQTGNDGTYVANMSSQEAWIWYGHLWLPDNSGAWSNNTLPGQGGSAGANPNSYYSSQFLLGREAMLLRQVNSSGHILDNSSPGVQQAYFQNISYGSLSTDNGASMAALIQSSRYDLVGSTINGIQKSLASYIASNPNQPWWDALHAHLIYNFQTNPFLTKPLTSAQMAQASPIFLQGCSQFIVEFAGDFVTQNNNPNAVSPAPPFKGSAASPNPTDGTYGDVVSDTSDGTIDFVVDKTADPTKANPALWRRQIRWYGLPRDTNGDGIAQGWKNGLSNNDLLDVVPVRDVVLSCIYGPPAGFSKFPWESFSANMNTPLANYADTNGAGISPTSGQPSYTVALGPNDPRIKMIRITITLDDPNGRLTDGQTYQYVYTLP